MTCGWRTFDESLDSSAGKEPL